MCFFTWNMTIGGGRFLRNTHRVTGRMHRHSRMSTKSGRTIFRSLMSSVVDSHAKMFHLPETAPVWKKAHALVCGQNSGALLANFDPERLSWRMLQGFSLWGEVQLLETLPDWGTWGDGELFKLPTPMLPTPANGFSLWPTPDATDNRVRRLNTERVLIRKTGAIRYISPKTTNSGTTSQIRITQAVAFIEGMNYDTHEVNIEWDEAVMGFPPGWTDLEDFPPTRIKVRTRMNRRVLSRKERGQIVQSVLKRSATR